MEHENENEKSINLKLSDYKQKGLYLIFKDSTVLALTKENIEKKTNEFWKKLDTISPEIKKAADIQRCSICPLKGSDTFCNALRPLVPFLDVVDKFASFDKVLAIYKGENENIYHVANTTMQSAFKYISILSLIEYCQSGKKYWKYFLGVIPMMRGMEVATKMYLNLFIVHMGNKKEIAKVISEFNQQEKITSQNQLTRLRLICKKDVFLNAFVNTQIAFDFLTLHMDKLIDKAFDDYKKTIDFKMT